MTASLHYTIKVKGMMCEHCEARVKKALEELPQVEVAVPDYKTGLVEVELNTGTDVRTLKKTVQNEGYKVITVK